MSLISFNKTETHLVYDGPGPGGTPRVVGQRLHGEPELVADGPAVGVPPGRVPGHSVLGTRLTGCTLYLPQPEESVVKYRSYEVCFP